MSAVPILVVATGTANTASMLAGLGRAGGDPSLAHDPDRIECAPAVVLPGVGTFHAAMAELRARGLEDALARRVRAGRPTLLVCLGLQLLCESSEESPGSCGLGLLAAGVRRLDGGARVPHMGWNCVTPFAGKTLIESGHAYFAHSFALADAPAGWQPATVEYGGRWIAALEREALLACQFHPELSGAWGIALLARWIARAAEERC